MYCLPLIEKRDKDTLMLHVTDVKDDVYIDYKTITVWLSKLGLNVLHFLLSRGHFTPNIKIKLVYVKRTCLSDDQQLDTCNTLFLKFKYTVISTD